MNIDDQKTLEKYLRRAREGDRDALGELLEAHRNYLLFLARLQIAPHLGGKLDASDVVQETFLDAYQSFPSFRGETAVSFLAWLRQILAARLAATFRRYLGAKQRDIRREQNIRAKVDQSSIFWEELVSSASTPSLALSRKEAEAQLRAALEKLPEHYQMVLHLRQIEELPFTQIAERMGRSIDSVQKIWVRALARLKDLVKE
ncbi:MAG: sigma-70 family RNA polymerase sigma factor [Planctomycetia bacterium]|nr:sigma-70 family RNA polymerase sigma factor [Planctomycetia bacterium]